MALCNLTPTYFVLLAVLQMKIYFNAYEEFLRENLPRLYMHFTKCGLTSDLYLIDWYDALLIPVCCYW